MTNHEKLAHAIVEYKAFIGLPNQHDWELQDNDIIELARLIKLSRRVILTNEHMTTTVDDKIVPID